MSAECPPLHFLLLHVRIAIAFPKFLNPRSLKHNSTGLSPLLHLRIQQRWQRSSPPPSVSQSTTTVRLQLIVDTPCLAKRAADNDEHHRHRLCLPTPFVLLMLGH